MEALVQHIYPELADLGGSRSIQGVWETDALLAGHSEYGLSDGIAYDIILSNTGEAVLVTGTAKATVLTECARCLEPASMELEGDVEGYYLLESAESVDGYEDDEFDCVSEDGTIDLTIPVIAALVYALPFAIYCKEDCKGLCPHCGANLNDGPCACSEEPPVDPTNPFAALANLKFDEE